MSVIGRNSERVKVPVIVYSYFSWVLSSVCLELFPQYCQWNYE